MSGTASAAGSVKASASSGVLRQLASVSGLDVEFVRRLLKLRRRVKRWGFQFSVQGYALGFGLTTFAITASLRDNVLQRWIVPGAGWLPAAIPRSVAFESLDLPSRHVTRRFIFAERLPIHLSGKTRRVSLGTPAGNGLLGGRRNSTAGIRAGSYPLSVAISAIPASIVHTHLIGPRVRAARFPDPIAEKADKRPVENPSILDRTRLERTAKAQWIIFGHPGDCLCHPPHAETRGASRRSRGPGCVPGDLAASSAT